MSACLRAIGLGCALTLTAGASSAEPRWEVAPPVRLISDPCGGGSQGKQGASMEWIKAALIGRGHSLATVCAPFSQLDAAAWDAFEPDWLDLSSQSAARNITLLRLGRWSEDAESAALACYTALSADNYRGFSRYLAEGPADPCATP